MIRKIVQIVLPMVALLGAGPAFADIIVGSPADSGTGNCFPFGCAYNAEYQQVYTSSAFSGPITITGLEFFNTQFNNGAASMNSGTWTISFSTTPTDWNTLSGIFASNIGGDNTVVFTGNLSQPWAFGDTLDINLSTPFTYNPGSGNLLMDVNASGTSDSNGAIYFDINSTNNQLGRVYCSGGVACATGTTDSDYGLVTGFSTSATTSVPEPLTMSIFGAGLVGLTALRRRKTKKA